MVDFIEGALIVVMMMATMLFRVSMTSWRATTWDGFIEHGRISGGSRSVFIIVGIVVTCPI